QCQLNAISFVGDKLLAVGRKNQAICLWDAVSGQQLSPPDQPTASITSLAYSRDGSQIITAADNVRWWETAGGKKVRQLTIPEEEDQMRAAYGTPGLHLGPDGKYLAANRQVRGGVRIFDLEKGDELYELPLANTPFGTQTAFSGDGKVFVGLAQVYRPN